LDTRGSSLPVKYTGGCFVSAVVADGATVAQPVVSNSKEKRIFFIIVLFLLFLLYGLGLFWGRQTLPHQTNTTTPCRNLFITANQCRKFISALFMFNFYGDCSIATKKPRVEHGLLHLSKHEVLDYPVYRQASKPHPLLAAAAFTYIQYTLKLSRFHVFRRIKVKAIFLIISFQ
jgi:hypothetical protein